MPPAAGQQSDETPVPRVLVIEDLPAVAQLLTHVLVADGFHAEWAQDGDRGLALARATDPDVVLLDLGLPGLGGLEVCRRLREFTDAYVIMVTGRDSEVDKVLGLSAGADDYLTKPFSNAELVARVRAMLRRPRAAADPAPTTAPAPTETLVAGDLVVDLLAHEARVGATPLALTRTEFDLLAALAADPRRVCSRAELLTAIRGEDWFGDDHVVDVHLSNLRRKLEAVSGRRCLHTVRGVGVRLVCEADAGLAHSAR